MSRKLAYRTEFGLDADKKIITAEDLDTVTLLQNNDVTIYSEQVPADKVYFWGYGPKSGELAEAYVEGSLVATGSGTGDDDDAIDAEVIVAITDSTQEDVLARRTVTDTGDLSDMASESRSDRLVFSETAPKAGEDKFLEIRLRARAGSDGVELDGGSTTDSTFKFYRGEVNV
jgi:hypothetical protein